MRHYFVLPLAAVLLLVGVRKTDAVQAIRGTKCSPNQVVNRLTVFEDGALEAECGPIPCGQAAVVCQDDQTTCRADQDVLSGMKWADNEQSLLLRCCSLRVPNKIYVGTDLVSAGSYYVGGVVQKKDKYGGEGAEYDFIANVRTEQGGVRVWVYRMMCGVADKRISAAPTTAAGNVAAAAGAGATQSPASAFQKRREYLLKHLADQRVMVEQKQQAQRAAQNHSNNEEDGDEDAEYEENNDGEVESVPAEPINPLQYRPAAAAAKTES